MKYLIVGFALMATGASAQETCLHQEQVPEPVMVMGTLWQPQSNVLVAGDCDKTYAELHAAYLAAPKLPVDHRTFVVTQSECRTEGNTRTCTIVRSIDAPDTGVMRRVRVRAGQ